MRLQWKDPDFYDGCRAVACRARSLWELTTDGYYDRVCLFHLAAYMVEFVALQDSNATVTMRAWKKPKLGRYIPAGTLNGPTGDLRHLIGFIPIERSADDVTRQTS